MKKREILYRYKKFQYMNKLFPCHKVSLCGREFEIVYLERLIARTHIYTY